MNFFKHQDDAKRKSTQLVLLFVFAIVSLILVTAFFIGAFLYYFESHATSMHAVAAQNTSFATHAYTMLQSPIFLWIVLGICGVVLLGVVLKQSELRKGGDYVAESLGGRLLLDAQTDSERVLLNVVEEMAIASGTPVPRVYVLEESAMNAFAAGHNSASAVVGITRGAIEAFNREEMQGVIAHEFSHIQNGDMKLNMRLLALVNGIMFIGFVGELLARSAHYRSFSSRRKGKNQLAIIGIGLIVIGYCGTFFGNMIKSAVSRQREFLADASAVQYTRNPQGIAKALLKIKQHVYGSKLNSENASQFSHFYFSSGVSHFFRSLFATHPNIDIRIARIYPRGLDEAHESHATSKSAPESQAAYDGAVSSFTGAAQSDTASEAMPAAGDSVEARLLDEQIITESVALREGIQNLHEAARDSYRARVIAYNLLVDSDATAAQSQIHLLENELHPVSFSELIQLKPQIETLNTQQQFALLQTSAPALQILSVVQKHTFLKVCRQLIAADKRITLREWAIYHFLKAALDDSPIQQVLTIDECEKALKCVLRFTAEFTQPPLREQAYYTALGTMIATNDDTTDFPVKPKLKALSESLEQLKRLRALEKPRFLKALQLCIRFDDKVLESEDLMLRSIAACIDCPISL